MLMIISLFSSDFAELVQDLQLVIEEIRHRFKLENIAKTNAVQNYDLLTSEVQTNVQQVLGFLSPVYDMD